jgi:mannitol-specific phosphotransferase system IIBC component
MYGCMVGFTEMVILTQLIQYGGWTGAAEWQWSVFCQVFLITIVIFATIYCRDAAFGLVAVWGLATLASEHRNTEQVWITAVVLACATFAASIIAFILRMVRFSKRNGDDMGEKNVKQMEEAKQTKSAPKKESESSNDSSSSTSN